VAIISLMPHMAMGNDKAIEGHWSIVSYVSHGRNLEQHRYLNAVLSFNGGELQFVARGAYKAAYLVDASRIPKAIQWSWDDTRHHFITGIFTTEGGNLTLCIRECDDKDADKARPTEFRSTEENGCSLLVLSKAD
jgi:uncharacterized protein (TIGR03067 family)